MYPLARVLGRLVAISVVVLWGSWNLVRPAHAQIPANPVESDPVSPPAISDATPAPQNTGNLDTGDSVAMQTSPGQADFDEAILKRFDADSDEALSEVSASIESAQKKGLDPASEAMASEILGSVRFERAQRKMADMIRNRGGRAIQLRDEVLTLLDSAVQADPGLTDAHLLTARIKAMSGDRDGARTSASKAVELLANDPAQRSQALVMRAMTQPSVGQKLTDLNAAIQTDAENIDAYQARATIRLAKGDIEAGVADLRKVLQSKPGDKMTTAVVVEKLVQLDRTDEALRLVDETIEDQPSEEMFKLRALLHQRMGNNAAATADLDAALKLQPKDPIALLQRAELSLSEKDVASAKADLKTAMNLAPRLAGDVKALALKAQIAIVEERVSDAINTMTTIAEKFPDEPFWQLRLATLYSMDSRPRRAIDVLSSVLRRDPENVAVLRTRGDTLLSVGDHAAAINDYEDAIDSLGSEEAVQADPSLSEEAAGLYNNLAWVLSTSTLDEVRDGEKALRYGIKASELTEYKEAHVLSTLAAAHAENGDFEAARRWSEKAVQIATEQGHDQIEQLQQEFEAYQKDEPWREKQETEENAVPLLSPDDLIDT